MKGTKLLALALAAVLLAGCGGQDQTSPAGPRVRTDWTRVEQAAQPRRTDVGGRWYEEPTDHLIPGPDYGSLIPFVGGLTYAFREYEDNSGQPTVWYDSWPSTVYGLMTRDGRVVVDPVYTRAHMPSTWRHGNWEDMPLLMLSQVREEWRDINEGEQPAVAALDGSWATEFEFWTYTSKGSQLLLAGPKGTQLDSITGARKDWTWASLGVAESELDSLVYNLTRIYGMEWLDQGIFLGIDSHEGTGPKQEKIRMFQPETGAVTWVTRAQWEEWSTAHWNQTSGSAQDPQPEWTIRTDGDQVSLTRGEERYTVTIPDVSGSLAFTTVGTLGHLTSHSGNGLNWVFRLSDGNVMALSQRLEFLTDKARPDAAPWMTVWTDDGGVTIYDPELDPFLTLPAPGPNRWLYISLWDGILIVQDDATFAGYYDGDTGKCIFYRNLGLGD